MSKIRRVLLYSFLLLSPLAFSKFTYNYTIFKLILPQIFFLFIALTFLIEKKIFYYHKPLTIVLSLYLLFNLLSFLVNPFHHLSYPHIMQLLTYFSIFLITVNLKKDKRLFFFLFVSGALLSLWAISDFLKFHLVNAGFGNKNFFAGYIIFLIPLSLSFVIIHPHLSPPPSRGRIYHKIIFLSLFLLYSFALLLTKSQAAYLATIGAILFLFAVNSTNRKILLLKTSFILFFLFLISIFSHFYFVNRITENVRLLVWRGTIDMIKVHPLLGSGPGTFTIHYPNYRIPEYFLQKAVAPITAHAHNEYLEILSETGIFGLLLFLGFIFLFFKEAWKTFPPPLISPPSREG
ncbi:MAG: O-antigen ligase family protein, partial [Candidatus Omnitrophica bacterium]|nr:O-antigen ligase family protein [Candidatus Omnitrophota bacterium]